VWTPLPHRDRLVDLALSRRFDQRFQRQPLDAVAWEVDLGAGIAAAATLGYFE
jgi:hypothetical protein